MKQLTEWLERAAVTINLKRVNWWLKLVAGILILGFSACILYGDYLAVYRHHR